VIAGVNTVVAGVLLAILLGLGEIAVRVFAPQQLQVRRSDIWQPVDTLGWVHRANLRTTINTGERLVHVVTDSNGFRVGIKGPTPAKKHVLLLGDSFVEAFQVEYEQSMAGLLEVRLPAKVGASVAVVNTGVGAWDPPQYYLQARALLGKRSFDAILVSLTLLNDIVLKRPDRFLPRAPTELHHFRVPGHLTFTEFADALGYPINDYLVEHSQLFVFFKLRLRLELMRLHLTAYTFPNVLLKSEATSPRWAFTADICRDIAALGAEHGIPTLFVLMPSPYQVDRASFLEFVRGFGIDPAKTDMDQPDRLMQAELERRGLRVLDALPVLRAAATGGVRMFGPVDNHPSPEGHDAVERLIEPALVDLLTAAQRPSARKTR